MAPEKKSGLGYTKKISGRSVTGIFSTFGVIDSYNDIVMPGAFAASLAKPQRPVLHLWQHDDRSPPIATITSIREVGRDGLPPVLLAAYPEATGGMEVTRTYADTPRGNEVLTLLTEGVPLQMSFMFIINVADFGEQNGQPVRFIRSLDLWEVSDVLWGANPATVASKRQSQDRAQRVRAQRLRLQEALLRSKGVNL